MTPTTMSGRKSTGSAVPLKENKPFLGICLGAQMLARHLGGRVYAHPRWPCGDRLLPDPADRARPRDLRSVAGAGLSVASRRLRSAARRGAAGRGRHVSGAGVPLWRPPMRCNSIPTSPTRRSAAGPCAAMNACCCRDAKPRAAHFSDRAVHDPAGRAWLAAFSITGSASAPIRHRAASHSRVFRFG